MRVHSSAEVKKAPPGRHRAGPSLYLKVSKLGSKSWVFRYTRPGTNKVTEHGLGTTEFVSLEEARNHVKLLKRMVYQGIDPITEKRIIQNCPIIPQRRIRNEARKKRYEKFLWVLAGNSRIKLVSGNKLGHGETVIGHKIKGKLRVEYKSSKWPRVEQWHYLSYRDKFGYSQYVYPETIIGYYNHGSWIPILFPYSSYRQCELCLGSRNTEETGIILGKGIYARVIVCRGCKVAADRLEDVLRQAELVIKRIEKEVTWQGQYENH